MRTYRADGQAHIGPVKTRLPNFTL
jgi:hypothetical protein